MNTRSILRSTQKLAADNAPAIMTGIGVTGVVLTAFFTGSATVKAVRIVDELNIQNDPIPTQKEIFAATWKLYVPAAATSILTVSSIVLAQRISNRRATALAAAYSLTEKALFEYKEKVAEHLGAKKEEALRDEIAQDRLNANPVSRSEVIMTGATEVLCYEANTGRYFMSSVETIKQAENKINHTLIHDMYVSLSDFYDLIGLAPTTYSNDVGWTSDKLLEVEFHAGLSDDQRPCIVVDYKIQPTRGFNRFG